MKLFQDYKKQFKTILFLALLGLSLTPMLFIHAQTASQIQNQIDQKNSDISSLEQQIASYQSQLETIGQQKSSLAQSLNELALTSKKLNADITLTQRKIDKTNLTIQSLTGDIGNKETAIGNSLNSIAFEIKNANELDQNSLVEQLISEEDFSSLWNDFDNAVSIRDTIKENINTLQNTKTQLESTKTATVNAKNDLVKLKSQLGDQQKIVIQNTNDKNKLLAQTKDSETAYQQLLVERLNKRDELEKELASYESQLKYILNPSLLPKGKVLSWPMDSILVTNLFGKNTSATYASTGFHNGVDFRAAIGTPVKALANGIVSGTGDTDIECKGASFGRFVLIKYNNGLASTFGHLSLIKVTNGQKVLQGDVVGYSGNTGYSTAPHLHVSVYARDGVDVKTLPSKSCPGKILTQPIAATNAYLDPLVYLPPTLKSMFKSTIVVPD